VCIGWLVASHCWHQCQACFVLASQFHVGVGFTRKGHSVGELLTAFDFSTYVPCMCSSGARVEGMTPLHNNRRALLLPAFNIRGYCCLWDRPAMLECFSTPWYGGMWFSPWWRAVWAPTALFLLMFRHGSLLPWTKVAVLPAQALHESLHCRMYLLCWAVQQPRSVVAVVQLSMLLEGMIATRAMRTAAAFSMVFCGAVYCWAATLLHILFGSMPLFVPWCQRGRGNRSIPPGVGFVNV
jgi:hypothetical protein